jgi:uncharacterized protein (TIGR00369 family)
MADAAQTYRPVEGSWAAVMGVRFVRASAEEVVAELDVGPHHLQAYGLVHGGVYSGLIETAASLGASIAARAHRRSVVGLENHTSFLHATRSGTLRAVAVPVHRGRTTQLWQASVNDADGRVVASGRVRLLSLEHVDEKTGAPVR